MCALWRWLHNSIESTILGICSISQVRGIGPCQAWRIDPRLEKAALCLELGLPAFFPPHDQTISVLAWVKFCHWLILSVGTLFPVHLPAIISDSAADRNSRNETHNWWLHPTDCPDLNRNTRLPWGNFLSTWVTIIFNYDIRMRTKGSL